ncbi:nicalin [Exaiptasia diaphana]|uniref:Nicalin n=1 Tax=Exaiptasia diaphana TaxID=2652724 RepID=A0A913XDV0_EXADI|nr:nicalin [Exaiptasia diaphana]KXJ26263.1 Nicalin-1 [Exaiptasia diaphana]
MIEHGTDILEFLKNFPISVSILCVIPFVILSGPVSSVNGAHEFPVFRMQQFDLHQVPAGSRSALLNMEARPLSSEVLTRRCVVTKLSELTIDRFRQAVESGAGGFLILLPRHFMNLTQVHLEEWQVLEKELLSKAVPVAVYFAYQDDYLEDLHNHIQVAVTSDQAGSAFEALLGVTSASGYQLVSTASESKQKKDTTITNMQGKLAGMGVDENLPTIAIVAHYDTFGMVPSLANGSDSNASGVVALLELARVFSRLYTDLQSHAKYHLVFFLSGGGKFNYQGTKKWLEDSIDNPEQSALNEVDFVLCLDSLSQGDNLFLHVSKPPKEGTRAYDLIEEFKMVASTLFSQLNFSIIHKKINLAEEMLSWEHERFSIHTQRLPAGTLSHFEDPTSSARRSMFDIRWHDDKKLERNINFIAEGLARHIFNLTKKGYSKDLKVFTQGLAVDSEFIKTWMNYLGHLPRPAQALHKDHPFLQGIELALSRYIKDIKKTTVKADKRDPEFVFYDQLDAKMSAYRVKPAVFDLFLAVGIGSYLGIFYLAMTNFSWLSDVLQRQVVSNLKMKQT